MGRSQRKPAPLFYLRSLKVVQVCRMQVRASTCLNELSKPIVNVCFGEGRGPWPDRGDRFKRDMVAPGTFSERAGVGRSLFVTKTTLSGMPRLIDPHRDTWTAAPQCIFV